MKIDLQGKVVLITGGSRGIGASCVKYFAEAGAEIAFTFRDNFEASQKLISSIDPLVKIKFYQVDLESEMEICNCVDSVLMDFGKIDILVNNAGIWKYGAIESMTLDQWSETININLTSAFLFTKLVLPEMRKSNYGRVINISSTAGQRGEAFHSHYAASKGGIISFTKSLASEIRMQNITVNCVAPGWVDTDMSAEELREEGAQEKMREYIPLGRAATPDEIAGPVLFLASSLADHVHGEILNVNGGSVLCG
ncbi:MAG: SDR family oxidoreductase [Bacteroidetes bacterium]|nr:SDR family oxidoreductase [Bacteroidota bacterium]MBU1679280.1 SDR family oxidoreductase [Bacteroidota bacterium]MBU2506746.1 SDR family oxidoreductase [Bacteroidota bacterium]